MKGFAFCYNIKCSNVPQGPKARCSVCRYATYCSEECQKLDWAFHKFNCRKLSIFETKSKTMDEDQRKIEYTADEIHLVGKLIELMSTWVKYENSCECSSKNVILCCLKEENYYWCYLRCVEKNCKFLKMKPIFRIGEIDKKLFWCAFSDRLDIVTFFNNGCKAYTNPMLGYTMITSNISGQPEPILVKKKDKNYYMINFKTDTWEPRGKKERILFK